MNLITGVTGHFGKAAVGFLLKKTDPSQIAVLVRDKQKATAFKAQGIDVREGDYNDYDSLVRAFKGVDKLLFVSANDIAKRSQQQANVVRAAIKAGVKHVVYTSFQRKDESENSPIAFIAKAHIETERALQASGLTYTILKNALYADMIPLFAGEQVLQTGTLLLPAGEGKIGFATRQDMAEAAVNVLTSDGHQNKSYEIANETALTYEQVADIIAKVSGKPVAYVSPTPEAFSETLTKFGVPQPIIHVTTAFAQATAQGLLDFPGRTLETLLGRKPQSTEAFLTTIYGKV